MDALNNIEENFFAVGRYWGQVNSSLTQAGPVCAMNTGVSISDINWAWNEKPLTEKDAKTIGDIKEIYKKQNLRFWWWVYPCGKSLHTIFLLQDAGLHLIEKVPCMAADLNDESLEEKIPEHITISQVKNKKALLVWADISFRGFQMPERAAEQYNAFVSLFKLDSQSPQKLFLAYLDGKPVATSLLFMQNDTAGIYYVATLPAYRNKGLGFYITLAVMQAAKEAGFQNAILQATPSGAKVYRRIGFIEYCQAEIYKLKT